MTKVRKAFRRQFIASFLAAWCANEYNEACAEGTQDRLSSPPVEDAKFLADKALEHYIETIGEQP